MTFRITLAAPDIGPAEITAVAKVLRSGRLSLGPAGREFEQSLAEFCGAKSALAVSSGTAGLTLCLRCLGIGPGDEVLTVALTAMGTANAIAATGADPVFADIDPVTLNIDPSNAADAITQRTRAIVVVHLFGRPAPLDSIQELANRHDLIIIEDACEALGSYYDDRHVGTFGRAGVFGFYANKVITTGEGGAIISNDPGLIERCRALSNQGRIDMGDRFLTDDSGFNFRLSELHAALGLTQLRRLPDLLARRQQIAHRYSVRLSRTDGLVLPDLDPPRRRVSRFAFCVRLDNSFNAADRDYVTKELTGRGIQCGHYFPPVHLTGFFGQSGRYTRGDLPHTEAVAERIFALPFHTLLSNNDVDEVTSALDSILRALRSRRCQNT